MKMKIITVFALVIGSLPAFGIQCTVCRQTLLERDKYCPNCGRERYETPSAAPKPEIPASVSQPSPPPAVQEQWRQTSYDNRPESGSADGVGERLLGMGRGLATITLSPLNVFRGLTTSFNWLVQSCDSQRSDSFNLGHLGAVGAIIAGGVASVYAAVGVTFGSVTTCADVVNGSIDMVTVGYYGDWLYDSKESGKPTPWVWERKWNTSAVPWINRE